MASLKVTRGSDGLYRFTIKLKTGQVLATSEPYPQRRDAELALALLREVMLTAAHDHQPTLTTRMKSANLDALVFDPGLA